MVALGMKFPPDEIKLIRSALDEAEIVVPKTEQTPVMKVKLALERAATQAQRWKAIL